MIMINLNKNKINNNKRTYIICIKYIFKKSSIINIKRNEI